MPYKRQIFTNIFNWNFENLQISGRRMENTLLLYRNLLWHWKCLSRVLQKKGKLNLLSIHWSFISYQIRFKLRKFENLQSTSKRWKNLIRNTFSCYPETYYRKETFYNIGDLAVIVDLYMLILNFQNVFKIIYFFSEIYLIILTLK